MCILHNFITFGRLLQRKYKQVSSDNAFFRPAQICTGLFMRFTDEYAQFRQKSAVVFMLTPAGNPHILITYSPTQAVKRQSNRVWITE